MPLSLWISFHPLHLLPELFVKEVLSEFLEQLLEPQCIFGDRVLLCSLMILLIQPPELCDYRHVPPLLILIEFWALLYSHHFFVSILCPPPYNSSDLRPIFKLYYLWTNWLLLHLHHQLSLLLSSVVSIWATLAPLKPRVPIYNYHIPPTNLLLFLGPLGWPVPHPTAPLFKRGV